MMVSVKTTALLPIATRWGKCDFGFLCLACVVLWAGWAQLSSAQGASRNPAMPFDLAVTRRTLASERISVSPDGRYVAYTVQTSLPEGESHIRLLPNGVPAQARGRRVYVASVSTKASAPAGPSDCNCWRPSFSYSGTSVAFYCDKGGAVHLWVYDLATRASRQVGDALIKAKLWIGDEPVWKPDGTEIFVPLAPAQGRPRAAADPIVKAVEPRVTVRRAGMELAPGETAASTYAPIDPMAENNATLASIALSTGVPRIMVDATVVPPPSTLQLSPSGRWASYLPAKGLELAVVPSSGGVVRVVTRSLPFDRTTGFSRAALNWHPTLDILYWIQDHRLWMLDPNKDDAPRQLAPALTDLTIGPVAFTRDGRYAVVGTLPVELDDFHNPLAEAIALVPLDGSATRTLRLPPGLYLLSPVYTRGSSLWQPDDNHVTLTCQSVSDAERVVLRIDLRSGESVSLWKGFANLDVAASSDDQAVLLGTFEDVRTTDNVYRFDRDFSEMTRITDIEPRLNGLDLGPPVETFVTAVPQPDGHRVEATTAVLLPPGARRGERLPTVVCQYPGLALSHRAIGDFGGGGICGLPMTLFTTRGYAALLVDGPIGPQNTRPGNPAAEMTDVVVAQVYHAAELGYTDLARVAIIGGSAGGYSTAAVISRTALFSAAIATSGFYDLAGWQEENTVIHRRMGANAWADLQRYIVNSPYYRAHDIHTPLLIVHGENDAIPVSEPRKLFDALRTLGQTVQLATYKGEGHNIPRWSLVNAVDVAHRMVDFLDRYVQRRASSGGDREESRKRAW